MWCKEVMEEEEFKRKRFDRIDIFQYFGDKLSY